MKARAGTPRPLLLTVPGVAFQLVGTFALPFVVGLMASVVFDTLEVQETSPALLAFTVVLLLPVSLAQAAGVLLKSVREFRFHRARGSLTVARLFDILYRHLRVVTSRGWSMLLVATAFVAASLAFKWASLGIIATLGLFLFYAVVGWTVFTSTFLVRSFDRGLGRAHTGIERSVQPAVCLSGAEADEVFLFRRVPVPWGYRLLVEDVLPVRLGGQSRYVVGAAAQEAELIRRGRLRRTPRGVHLLGPAQLWYQDVLGLTRIHIASLATAELKVLPRIRPLQILEPPRSSHSTPDVRTRPHRQPTEDLFRFREYVAGDDTRRIHWTLSMRTGGLQVRRPETREITKRDVLLLLDTYVPRGADRHARLGAEQLLDQVVETALGLTRTLVDRGERVRIVTSALTPDFSSTHIEQLDARPGAATRWQDLGARVRWQSEHDIEHLVDALDEQGHAIVVTARFNAPPPRPLESLSTTWVFMDPSLAFHARERHWLSSVLDRPGGPLLALFTRPHPVGSDDNSLSRRALHAWRLWRTWRAKTHLQRLARRRIGATATELARRGDAVYRIEHSADQIVLRGLSGGGLA